MLASLCFLLVPVKSDAVTDEEARAFVALLTKGTMVQRQKRVPWEDMLAAAPTRQKKSMADILQEMAQEAYRIPVFTTQAEKTQTNQS